MPQMWHARRLTDSVFSLSCRDALNAFSNKISTSTLAFKPLGLFLGSQYGVEITIHRPWEGTVEVGAWGDTSLHPEHPTDRERLPEPNDEKDWWCKLEMNLYCRQWVVEARRVIFGRSSRQDFDRLLLTDLRHRNLIIYSYFIFLC